MTGQSTPHAFDGGHGDELPGWELAFRFSSGRLCLDFCATIGERWRRNFERLRTPADLRRWVVNAGLTEQATAVSARLLDQARALREAIYRLVRAAMAEGPSEAADRELVNTWAAAPDLAPQLGPDGNRSSRAGRDPARACLATVARDAVDLLSGPQIARVRECAASDCALLFVDCSRPGRRRWCSERACGTRARSASYRQRQAAARAPSAPKHPKPGTARARQLPGAKAVMIGRAYLWGLAANGQAGVENVLDVLRGGIDSVLLGLGHASIHEGQGRPGTFLTSRALTTEHSMASSRR